MKADRIAVMVSRETFDNLKSFSGAMRRTASGVIEQALNDWLDTVGHANLEAQATAANVKAVFNQPICIDEYKDERSEGASA